MTTFILVITLFSASVEAGKNVNAIVHGIKAVHHHTTRPLYRHVLKPIGKAVER
jgi:hypothetical protein